MTEAQRKFRKEFLAENSKERLISMLVSSEDECTRLENLFIDEQTKRKSQPYLGNLLYEITEKFLRDSLATGLTVKSIQDFMHEFSTHFANLDSRIIETGSGTYIADFSPSVKTKTAESLNSILIRGFEGCCGASIVYGFANDTSWGSFGEAVNAITKRLGAINLERGGFQLAITNGNQASAAKALRDYGFKPYPIVSYNTNYVDNKGNPTYPMHWLTLHIRAERHTKPLEQPKETTKDEGSKDA
jgi:hypothetical protein